MVNTVSNYSEISPSVGRLLLSVTMALLMLSVSNYSEINPSVGIDDKDFEDPECRFQLFRN